MALRWIRNPRHIPSSETEQSTRRDPETHVKLSRNSGGEMVDYKPGIPWRRSWTWWHKAGLGAWGLGLGTDDCLVFLAGTSSHLDAALSGDRHTLLCALQYYDAPSSMEYFSADVEVNHAGLGSTPNRAL